MGYEVRLTARARGDLNEIVAYIAQDNPLAAERLGDELAAEADSLSNYPHRVGLVRRRRNVRRLVHGSYLIVYRIFESNRLNRDSSVLARRQRGAEIALAGG